MKPEPTNKANQGVSMSRHRIEDLGRIFERLDAIVDHDAFKYESEWEWQEQLKDEDKREEMFHLIRDLNHELFDIRSIAAGDDVLNETTV